MSAARAAPKAAAAHGELPQQVARTTAAGPTTNSAAGTATFRHPVAVPAVPMATRSWPANTFAKDARRHQGREEDDRSVRTTSRQISEKATQTSRSAL